MRSGIIETIIRVHRLGREMYPDLDMHSIKHRLILTVQALACLQDIRNWYNASDNPLLALALKRSRSNRQAEFAAAEAHARVASLTPRERDIVRLVVEGLLNKEIADQLDLALITVKVHRGRAMRKLVAGNPAEMVHIAELGRIGRRPHSKFEESAALATEDSSSQDRCR